MQRIQSVDVFRGITVVAMILVNNPGDWLAVYAPLLHAKWHGLTFTDLIFPFFIFIVGISISLAYQNRKPSNKTYRKILVRGLKLIGLGIFLNAFIPYFPFFENYKTIRIPGVLQRIGIVFCITAFLYLKCNKKITLIISVCLLILYNLFLGLIPLPNGLPPSYQEVANNWAMYIDVKLLSNHLWKPTFDPEGVVSTIPTIVSCLIGVFVGDVLKLKSTSVKIKKLISYTCFFLVVGYLWSVFFPINKTLWTSSFVLVTAGWATLVLLIIYYICDYKEKNYGNLFVYVGKNAIAIYFLSSFISKSFYLIKISKQESIHSYLYTTLFTPISSCSKITSLFYAMVVCLFYLLLAYIFFKKKIFIKV